MVQSEKNNDANFSMGDNNSGNNGKNVSWNKSVDMHHSRVDCSPEKGIEKHNLGGDKKREHQDEASTGEKSEKLEVILGGLWEQVDRYDEKWEEVKEDKEEKSKKEIAAHRREKQKNRNDHEKENKDKRDEKTTDKSKNNEKEAIEDWIEEGIVNEITDEKDDERDVENGKLTEFMIEQKERLELELFGIEEEKKTLQSDAVVVRIRTNSLNHLIVAVTTKLQNLTFFQK